METLYKHQQKTRNMSNNSMTNTVKLKNNQKFQNTQSNSNENEIIINVVCKQNI